MLMLMSAVKTGQMSAAETRQISTVETGQMYSIETRLRRLNGRQQTSAFVTQHQNLATAIGMSRRLRQQPALRQCRCLLYKTDA